MAKMARRIRGTGYAPIDISTLVATDFINFEVLFFQLKDIGLHDIFNSNPKAMSADDIFQNLKTKFRSLTDQGLCSPA